MTIASILIANRGEIAVRVIRACRELGIRSIAVYSEADRFAMHTRLADVAVLIGPAPAQQSYLNTAAILAAAHQTGAEAIHPGYGFLSERADFAEACADAGLIFIGPPASAIRLMGSKTAAKAAVMRSDVPTVPGYLGEAPSAGRRGAPLSADAALRQAADRIGYPVLIKAAAGGGGKGMRAVFTPADFPDALAAARREALAAFGDETIFLEKLLQHARHIEFQILADTHGHCVYLGERECSIQRRHQKIVEEAPAVILTPELRAAMGSAAVRAAEAAGYTNAGTVEFMLDPEGNFYFLEMNTRLQVEHPVTEQVTGLDLVQLQIAIADQQPLPFTQDDLTLRGHAIEARLYAEDPRTGLPATGQLLAYAPPEGPGIRLDGGVAAGDDVSMYYDPMLAKLIVTAPDRSRAIARMRVALDAYTVLGVTTNLPLLRQILADRRFADGATMTDFLEDPAYSATTVPESTDAGTPPPDPALLALAALRARSAASVAREGRRSPWGAGALRADTYTARLSVAGQEHKVELRDDVAIVGAVRVVVDGVPLALGNAASADPCWAYLATEDSTILLRQGASQILGRAVATRDGAVGVTDGPRTLLCAPRRELDVDRILRQVGETAGTGTVTAPMAGTIIQVRVQPGDIVTARQTLVILGAMKMEHALIATGPGRVGRVHCQPGAVVAGGTVLVEITEIGETTDA